MTSSKSRVFELLGATILISSLLGCASGPAWRPGSPDAATTKDYNLTLAAIDSKSKAQAQAGIYLLQHDVTRMETNTLGQDDALVRLFDISNAINAEDWVKARSILLEQGTTYGVPAPPPAK